MAPTHISKFIIGLFTLIAVNLFAQQPFERAVLISSEIRNDSVHLNWNFDETVVEYTIFSRTLESTNWNTPIAVLPKDSLNFSMPLAKGESREIAIFKSNPDLFRDTIFASVGNYDIHLEDQFGKGLCCDFGIGFLKIKKDNVVLFEADDFDFEYSGSFELQSSGNLYLEIQPDLFGNHLGWEIIKTDTDSLISSFGPLGTYLRRAPSLGMIAVANKTTATLPNQSVLVLVDSEMFAGLNNELSQLTEDFIRAGFFPKIIPVPNDISAEAIKNMINDEYNLLNDLSYVYLVGHVPVPYSGDMYPDTHSDTHKGAWAADMYYADIDGNFTDTLVNETSAFFERTHNIPGDGKFDQSLIPSDLELIIGRIDFYDMGVISNDEMALTKKYLNKAHQWKTGLIASNHKGLVDDNFGRAFGAPASNGWRNLASLLGPENVTDDDFLTALTNEAHLWAYGCGSGTGVSAEGVATTEDLAEDSLQVIFLMTFGSNFGDWDSHDNFLRAPLASGTTLSNAWVGNPHWFMHQMGVGKSIGVTAFKNMNSDYLPGPQSMHMALMGDPTINQYPVKLIPAITINQSGNNLELNWEAPSEDEIYQYNIYHRNHTDTLWTLLTTESITDTFFNHTDPVVDTNYYLVQPLQLITNNSGCFYQSGLGTLQQGVFSIITSSEELSFSSLQIWPNPGNDILIVGNLNISDSLKVFDQNGKLIFEEANGNKQEISIDTSQWPEGIYIVQFGEKRGKFLKVKN